MKVAIFGAGTMGSGIAQVILAKAVCKNISKEEVHQLVDEIYSNYADET